MQQILRGIAFAVVALAVLTGPAQAADMDKAVAARQAVMKLRSFYLGQIGAMAKAKMPYDAKKAQGAANSLLALESLDSSAMWVPGSGADKLGDKTRAKPEIWSTYPDVATKAKALKSALANLVKVAGTGLDGLRSGIGDVGKSCGGCHKPFRTDKK
ncbi:MAG: cytochrome C554 [Rhodospirillaceae bacterium]|jgi:cytochrome c556|nr:cytochrome C554 [Rhodospirillaceae bacterium]MDP6624728.1 cytochrome c [Alphaproteobacteria bacterium]|tara:strand:- start:95 stop:565 length:471 start_codon:yes stop_codon:yes gene_type:complete